MAKPALLILDLINELIHDDGKFSAFGYPALVKERGVVANANGAIAKARQKGVPVIFVRVGFSSDYRECPEASPLFGAARKYGALKLDTWATEVHADIDRRDDDIMITKHRVSAFYSTSLEAILRGLGIDTLLLGGVATDLVVQTTAREAHDRDYTVVVLEDLCAAASSDIHEGTIETLRRIARVESSAEVQELS